ncbi:DUF7344 domain-containing protein [Halorussus lipolyticus]|uniref:DUF7344 domain-containing protein n=1 Tax=Halorussus lipolyticus TaxID=3034024 RepID=UPI0023E76DF4|nr:hypothetical protein [Halorussus sp. DT80]
MSSDGPDADPSTDPSEVDSAFRVLSDVHRRYALYYLRDRETTNLEELATVLASWLGARDDANTVITPEERERLLVALHHAHLPDLDAAGLVRYDSVTGDVSLNSLPEVVETALNLSLAQQREAPGRPEKRRFGWRAGR